MRSSLLALLTYAEESVRTEVRYFTPGVSLSFCFSNQWLPGPYLLLRTLSPLYFLMEIGGFSNLEGVTCS